jgi:hypothetical protein
MRHDAALAALEVREAISAAATKEEVKTSAQAYFLSEDEKAKRRAATGKDGESEEAMAWSLAMEKRDDAADVAEAAKVPAVHWSLLVLYASSQCVWIHRYSLLPRLLTWLRAVRRSPSQKCSPTRWSRYLGAGMRGRRSGVAGSTATGTSISA